MSGTQCGWRAEKLHEGETSTSCWRLGLGGKRTAAAQSGGQLGTTEPTGPNAESQCLFLTFEGPLLGIAKFLPLNRHTDIEGEHLFNTYFSNVSFVAGAEVQQ